ncbi:MAG: biotin transporter BioY [Chlamydiae bacterium]|nr:biotin transporter BioY [Chlamydiota bacterium]
MTTSSISLSSYKELQGASRVKQAITVLGASVLISLCSQISFPLPFTPVPLTVQCNVILLLAAMLGSKRGALAVVAFLVQGAMGLPVFAGGTAGLLCLAGPTGGYLLGYVAAAFFTGYLVENMKQKTAVKAFFAMAAGNALIYFFGVAGLSTFIGWTSAFMLGAVPFIIGDLLKLLLS